MPSVFLLRRCYPSLQKAHEELAGMADWRVCGSSERVREAPAQIEAHSPDIVATDLRLLDGDASRLAYALQRWPQRPQLLLLTPSADELQLFDALRFGASGYCVEAGNGQGLSEGLNQLADHRASMTPQIARQTLAQFGLARSSLVEAQNRPAAQDLSPADASQAGLQRAEQHLLSLLAHGLLSAEIGQRWSLERRAIEQRLWRIYTRLHARVRRTAALLSA